jgi:predicted metalloprotease with PDZ domain
MDRLVDGGLIERRSDPDDRRNSLIILTETGRSLFQRIVPAHLDNEQRLLIALTDTEREMLETLLRKLLVEYEGTVTPDAPFRLGLTVAPAHVAIAMRRAVGLSSEPGLLVKHVAAGGPAARSGLQAGDLLIRGGRHDLTSVASLYAAIADVARARRLKLQIIRGAQHTTITVTLRAAPAAQDIDRISTTGRGATDEHVV